MPIVSYVQEQQADERVKKVYAKLKERYGGFVPDIYKAFANDPDYLESMVAHIDKVMAPGKVDFKTKEIIAFVVSAKNGCDFCINAHAMGLKRMGYDDEALAEILGVVGLWEEITRFAVGARVNWPRD